MRSEMCHNARLSNYLEAKFITSRIQGVLSQNLSYTLQIYVDFRDNGNGNVSYRVNYSRYANNLKFIK